MLNNISKCLQKSCASCLGDKVISLNGCSLEEFLYNESIKEPYSKERTMYYQVRAKFELFINQEKDLSLSVPEMLVLNNRYR